MCNSYNDAACGHVAVRLWLVHILPCGSFIHRGSLCPQFCSSVCVELLRVRARPGNFRNFRISIFALYLGFVQSYWDYYCNCVCDAACGLGRGPTVAWRLYWTDRSTVILVTYALGAVASWWRQGGVVLAVRNVGASVVVAS